MRNRLPVKEDQTGALAAAEKHGPEGSLRARSNRRTFGLDQPSPRDPKSADDDQSCRERSPFQEETRAISRVLLLGRTAVAIGIKEEWSSHRRSVLATDAPASLRTAWRSWTATGLFWKNCSDHARASPTMGCKRPGSRSNSPILLAARRTARFPATRPAPISSKTTRNLGCVRRRPSILPWSFVPQAGAVKSRSTVFEQSQTLAISTESMHVPRPCPARQTSRRRR